jgi:hypothetical protein
MDIPAAHLRTEDGKQGEDYSDVNTSMIIGKRYSDNIIISDVPFLFLV